MKCFALISIIVINGVVPSLGRKARPLFGDRFADDNEIGDNLRPRSRYLKNDMELKAETRRLQTEIDKINRALTEEEKNAVLLDPDDMDPMGYTCTKEVLELNEITYLDQLLCFNTTEEQCYKSQKTQYVTKQVEECKENFKKICWIDMKEKVTTKMVTICSTKPERQCTKPDGPSFRDDKLKQKCRNVYETVCETQHIQKTVTESKPICTTTEMTMEVDGQLVTFPTKNCKVEEVEVLKAIPITECKQQKYEMCHDEACPWVVQRKICEDVEKSFVSYVPDEHCELEPYEVCNFVQKQYPTLVEEEFCKTVPRETCDPERVLPKQETKPLVKKVCVEESQDMSEDDDDNNNDLGDEGTTFPPSSGITDTEDISQGDNAGGEDSNDVRFFANLRNSLVETNSLPKRPTWHRNGKIMPLF